MRVKQRLLYIETCWDIWVFFWDWDQMQIENTFWDYPTFKETGNGTGSTEPDAIPSDTDEFPPSHQMIKDVKMVRNGKSNKKRNKTVNSWSDGQVFTAANIKKKRQMKVMYIYFVLHPNCLFQWHFNSLNVEATSKKFWKSIFVSEDFWRFE